MTDSFEIRDEQQADVSAIRDVVTAAFEASKFGHHGEAALVDTLRKESAELISLVAEADGEIIGHVALTPVEIRSESSAEADDHIIAFGLAPLAVSPENQSRGIGSQLVQAAVQRAVDRSATCVVLIGEPEFYGRLGFEPAVQFQLTHTFDGIPQEYLLIRWLGDRTSVPLSAGTVHYEPAFEA